jgi:hypothetical protein
MYVWMKSLIHFLTGAKAVREGKEVQKGVWRMPRLSKAKKDVISCEKLRGGAHTHYIRRCPNGATRLVED